jgi:hypothetical protein
MQQYYFNWEMHACYYFIRAAPLAWKPNAYSCLAYICWVRLGKLTGLACVGKETKQPRVYLNLTFVNMAEKTNLLYLCCAPPIPNYKTFWFF